MNLYQAAIQGNTDAIRAAAEQGCDVNAPDKDGKTLL
jgi:ankyrin repeat protein